MLAIRHHAYGPADVLQAEEVADPVPADDQLLIAVEAAGVHLVDTSLRRGEDGPFGRVALPNIPGREVAGTVQAVGIDVDPAWLGQRVVAHLGAGGGGYAELAVVAAARAYRIPEGADAATAVAAIGTGRTAAGILAYADLTADDVVAVPSAAGGLGPLLLQGAHQVGARTVGLAGGEDKVAIAAGFAGPDGQTIDYRTPGWEASVPDDLTVVLDGVGGEVGQALYERLRPGGRLVRFGWSSEKQNAYDDPDRPVIDVLGPPMLTRMEEFELDSMRALAAGTRVPYVGLRVPLAAAADAHRALEGRAATGKVVLIPGAAG